eukprot:scaffold122688_cov57-Phaeocystis_antarctica.AAC.1
MPGYRDGSRNPAGGQEHGAAQSREVQGLCGTCARERLQGARPLETQRANGGMKLGCKAQGNTGIRKPCR